MNRKPYNLIERLWEAVYEFVKPQKRIKRVHPQKHVYTYQTGQEVTVENVVQVTIFPTGCKGLLDSDGAFFIVPPFWMICRVEYNDKRYKIRHVMENEACA